MYGPGEYLGEMSLDGGPRSAKVITLEASGCVVITRKTLERHIAEQPQFAFELIDRVIRRARAATSSATQSRCTMLRPPGAGAERPGRGRGDGTQAVKSG